MVNSPILGGFGVGRSKNAEDSDIVNLFLEVVDAKDGAAPGFLQMAPGLNLLVTVGTGPIRGPRIHQLHGIAYIVSGGELYALFPNLSKILLGPLETSAGNVSVIDNGRQVAIFDGFQGYLTTTAIVNGGGGVALTGGTISLANPGPGGDTVGSVGFAVGDTITLQSGVSDATAIITVTSVSADGSVASFTLTNAGTTYTTTTSNPTARGGGQPGTGSGLTIDITAASGPITASSLVNGGGGYAFNDTGTVTGGSGDATYLVNAVTGFGAVLSFSILQGGLFATPPTSFSELTTSGNGSNFNLINPTFTSATQYLFGITLPFTGGPVSAAYQDGFGLVNDSGTQQFYQSNLVDLSIWQALNFSSADAQPDNVVFIADLLREVFLFKTTNTEVWANAGQPGFTFQRLQGVFIEFGTCAGFTVAKAGQDMLYLAQNDQGNRVVVLADSLGVPKRVSTHALEYQIGKYTTVADAFAFVYQQEGHVFYVLTFPTASATWVLDLTTSEKAGYPIWHKRAAFANGKFSRWWANAFLDPTWGIGPQGQGSI
jgi:hypothetical protein